MLRRNTSTPMTGEVVKQGKDDTELYRQRYECRVCTKRFDDLTNTVFAGHHQPLKTWMICLYFMGLNLSSRQIAQELNINKDDVATSPWHCKKNNCQIIK